MVSWQFIDKFHQYTESGGWNRIKSNRFNDNFSSKSSREKIISFIYIVH